MVSTRNAPSYYRAGRRMGNSTRQADFAIQKLFQGEEVLVEDHYGKIANKHLLNMILKRLNQQFNIPGENIKITKHFDEITIRLVANYVSDKG